MGKKKIIEKEPAPEVKEETLDEKVDAFDLEEVPEDSAEDVSELEQELMGEEAFEEEIEEERYYVVPLAKKGFERVPRWKRAKKAMKVLREFITRHMKPEGDVYIAQELNERIWEQGIKHPPRKVRIRVTKSTDGIVRAYLG
jgi:large subunit ribosomal protein L31e